MQVEFRSILLLYRRSRRLLSGDHRQGLRLSGSSGTSSSASSVLVFGGWLLPQLGPEVQVAAM